MLPNTIISNQEIARESDKFAAERLLVLGELLEGDLDYDATISYIRQALHTQELDIKFVNVLTDLFTHVARWKDVPETINHIPRVDAQLLIWLIFSYSDAKKVWNKFVESTIEQMKDAEQIVENRSSMNHMENMRLEQRLRFVRTMLEDNLALDARAGSGLPMISNFRGCRMVSGALCPECLLDKVEGVYQKLKDHNDKDADFRTWYSEFGPAPQEETQERGHQTVAGPKAAGDQQDEGEEAQNLMQSGYHPKKQEPSQRTSEECDCTAHNFHDESTMASEESKQPPK